MALSKLTGDTSVTDIPTRPREPYLMAFADSLGRVIVSLVAPGPRTLAAGLGPTLPDALRDLADVIERKEAELPRPCPHCGAAPTFEHNPPPIPVRAFDWAGYCLECSDGDTPVPAHGATREECERQWNEYAEGVAMDRALEREEADRG